MSDPLSIIQISLDLLRLISLPEEFTLIANHSNDNEDSETKYLVPITGASGESGIYSDEDDDDVSVDEDHELHEESVDEKPQKRAVAIGQSIL